MPASSRFALGLLLLGLSAGPASSQPAQNPFAGPMDRYTLLASVAPAAPDSTDTTAVAELRREAHALWGLFSSELVKEFLQATWNLPHIEPRVVRHDSARTHYYNEAEAAKLADSTRARLVTRRLDDGFYYYTRYGTPLAYSRALDLLAAQGVTSVEGRRWLDFGYGGIGQLRLLASLGAQAVGVEVDPLLPALYSAPGDQGVIEPGRGTVKLVHGHWPGDLAASQGVGKGFDVVISKNVLKRGYIHPERPADERMLVRLGVSDSAFVAALREVLAPGGLALLYNLSPAPSPPDKPYKPWADGRCPFPRAMWESAGFEVLAFDADDSEFARRMGRALGWDEGRGAMDLEKDLFGHYTLVRRSR